MGRGKEKQIYETAFIHNEASEWEKCLARVSVHSVLRPRAKESEREREGGEEEGGEMTAKGNWVYCIHCECECQSV